MGYSFVDKLGFTWNKIVCVLFYTEIIIFNIVIITRNKQLLKEVGDPPSLAYSADLVMQN